MQVFEPLLSGEVIRGGEGKIITHPSNCKRPTSAICSTRDPSQPDSNPGVNSCDLSPTVPRGKLTAVTCSHCLQTKPPVESHSATPWTAGSIISVATSKQQSLSTSRNTSCAIWDRKSRRKALHATRTEAPVGSVASSVV